MVDFCKNRLLELGFQFIISDVGSGGIGTGSSGTCGGSGGTSGSTTKAARKKFLGNRSDISWAHGVELDENYKKIVQVL